MQTRLQPCLEIPLETPESGIEKYLHLYLKNGPTLYESKFTKRKTERALKLNRYSP